MKATRHNGRSGKHGTYDAKHNDRRFDVENSEHIDAERTKMNVYWDCYQGYSLQNDKDERARFTFTEIEKAYYVEKYSDHVDGQNERNRKARHYDRVKTIDAILENKSSNKILEEVIYTISLSLNDNYNVKEVNFLVNNKEICKNLTKTLEQ